MWPSELHVLVNDQMCLMFTSCFLSEHADQRYDDFFF